MNLAFVIPKDDDQHGPQNQHTQGRIFPPVGLARMAGIVGKQACVSLIDERIEHKHSVKKAQITIIFINSYNQQRACELARYYHDMGCLVIMTGPMLSHSVDLAYSVADCLFIGAGEDNLPVFLHDYSRGKNKRIYRSSGSQNTGTQRTSDHNGCTYEYSALSLAS